MDCLECVTCASGWWYVASGALGALVCVVLDFVASHTVGGLDRLLNHKPKIEIDIWGDDE